MTSKKTPLFSAHQARNAQMVDFAGVLLPVRYESESKEHLAVRNKAGLFDISHMGEIFIEGEDALLFLQTVLSNDASKLKPNDAQYSLLLNEQAGIIDDLIVYRLKQQKYLLCVNASNIQKDMAWLRKQQGSLQLFLEDQSDEYALLSLQGPLAEKILTGLLPNMPKRFQVTSTKLQNIEVLLARTGYTGEDGFEIFVKNSQALSLWDLLMKEGTSLGLIPCGLSARDTLRLEAGMCLYGHDIDEQTTPLEAGLMFAVSLDKPDLFVGKEALLCQQRQGVQKKRIGIRLLDNGIAREGYPIFGESEKPVGIVTSGSLVPGHKRSIAMGYVDVALAKVGQRLKVGIRKEKVLAVSAPLLALALSQGIAK